MGYKVQILVLTEQIALKDAQIAVLEVKIVEREVTLSVHRKTSKNSISRPSSDFKSNKPDDGAPKQSRIGYGKGGRLLHPSPTQAFHLKPVKCLDCGESLAAEEQQLYASYDKIELTEVLQIVTRVHLYICRCQKCGHSSIAPVPAGYEPGTPLANSVVKEIIDLKYNQLMSYKRLSRYMADRFCLSVSQGTIASIFKRYEGYFDDRVSEIYNRIHQFRIVASDDEKSARVRGKTEWEWVFTK